MSRGFSCDLCGSPGCLARLIPRVGCFFQSSRPELSFFLMWTLFAQEGFCCGLGQRPRCLLWPVGVPWSLREVEFVDPVCLPEFKF